VHIPRTDTVALIQQKIAEQLGPQRYKVWFKNATQFTIGDDHLKISAPNGFICDWIERHFSGTIGEIAQQVTGRECRLSFVVDTKLQTLLKKRQLDSQAEYIAKNSQQRKRYGRRINVPKQRELRGRFDQLVVGQSNLLAVSAIRNIASRSDANNYTPVFVHGGCGLGKTHLLQALANELTENHPQCRWAYLTGDEFTNEFVLAVRSNKLDDFRKRYRYVDVLIIDDVHFLANKKGTQEEFLHTFNAIDAQGKTIVLASDSHPKLIGNFSEHLVNRFVAGMVVRINNPDFEMRCEILRQRAQQSTRKPVPVEVIEYIARQLKGNVRELEGALLKLSMFSNLAHQPITLALAQRALADHLQRTSRSLGLDEIDQTVATYFGLTPADLHTSRKTRTIALARSIAMYLARKHTEMSFPEIGRFLGNKNHSTVILANRKIIRMLEADETVTRQTPAGGREEKLRDIVDKIEEQLGSRNEESATEEKGALRISPSSLQKAPVSSQLAAG
jgi:chromosomal replication initiator protein